MQGNLLLRQLKPQYSVTYVAPPRGGFVGLIVVRPKAVVSNAFVSSTADLEDDSIHDDMRSLHYQAILGGVSVVGPVLALYLSETWDRRNVRLLALDRTVRRLCGLDSFPTESGCVQCLRIKCR
ncbi:hypothetical protein L226DRAFT_529042 [Lentinus tigrinus ALCF2SS1-7]|uniref:uncharacterized protein n=1 Tax=Lentinus tigrinus ALCF2SS1-7 TaxID=1328758 RepID=UPI001165DF8B|nr:hypothetical protein L226DRAFT_529042 [Lentinus tigrinus ALCF2SS1-7]